MRNKYMLIVVLIVMFFLTACGGSTSKTNNSQLVDAVKQIEINQFKFMNFEITYNDYKKNTQKYMFDYYLEGQDEEILFGTSKKQYTGKDVAKMSLKEHKEIASEIMNQLYGSTEIKYCSVSISDEYYSEDDEDAIRYVYSKANVGIGEKDFTGYKKYTFLKDGDIWKVSTITKMSESNDYKLDETTLNEFINFGNSPVEYIETIEFLKDE